MPIYTFSIRITDYSIYHLEACTVRIERVATKKKPHFVIEAYQDDYNRDCLLACRMVDWWTLEPVPSFYLSSEIAARKFSELGFTVDYIP